MVNFRKPTKKELKEFESRYRFDNTMDLYINHHGQLVEKKHDVYIGCTLKTSDFHWHNYKDTNSIKQK
jgi:hypothetical protein